MSGIAILDMSLLALIVFLAIGAIEVRNLYSAVMLSSIYSLVMACFWMTNDAWDVAFTEAAVGAGISTILLIGTLVLTGSVETVRKAVSWPALATTLLAGALLIYGTLDMPRYGDPKAPAHTHPMYGAFVRQDVPKHPSGRSAADVAAWHKANPDDKHTDFFHGHVPNQVTSVIVSYRAFDTMFETAVILTAGMALILLLRGRRGNPQRGGLI
jgi:multicomponent Na+:H+ antiporter subunit B